MREKIDKNKLTIPVYLNTKIVYDMLATIDDGFSEVKNIPTSKSKNREDVAEANIGTVSYTHLEVYKRHGYYISPVCYRTYLHLVFEDGK